MTKRTDPFINSIKSYKVQKLECVMKHPGFDWDPYPVYTDDGWQLTLFRVKGAGGLKLPLQEKQKDKPPILIQHGYNDSESNWH